MKTLISVILLALSGITLSSCASDQPADSSTTTTTTTRTTQPRQSALPSQSNQPGMMHGGM